MCLPGEKHLPKIDINWLEPEQLSLRVIQQNEPPAAWGSAEVYFCCCLTVPCHLELSACRQLLLLSGKLLVQILDNYA